MDHKGCAYVPSLLCYAASAASQKRRFSPHIWRSIVWLFRRFIMVRFMNSLGWSRQAPCHWYQHHRKDGQSW
jgi:hypothetical protein